jgi:hypothetical protein
MGIRTFSLSHNRETDFDVLGGGHFGVLGGRPDCLRCSGHGDVAGASKAIDSGLIRLVALSLSLCTRDDSVNNNNSAA